MGRRSGSGVVIEKLDKRRAEFERLYLRKGLALRGVAAALGVSVKMLTLWMDDRGVPRRNRAQAQHNRSRKFGKVDRVIRLRLTDHVTMEQIAEWLGYASKGTVHNILASRGLDGPVHSLPTYEQYLKGKKKLSKVDQVIRLRLAEHVAVEQIAEWMGYASKDTVHSILASLGLDGPVETLPTYETYIRGKKDGRCGREKPAQAGSGDEESGDPGLDPTGHSK